MQNNSWWKKTTIYQIYPLSFYDSNDDGFGDINGIIKKLNYIRELGFETIWISPFYSSPMKDFGYDISDYLEINPIFGTMKDVTRLIKEVHKRKMKIIFDMVMNHTSDQHKWFKESASDRTNSKRDWYIWKKGKGKNPPNNWYSMIGNRGWNYDKKTDEWYYTSFLPFQPDLNYNNPEVKKAIFAIVKFWLKLGVDGFRLDIFNCIIKDPQLRDNPFIFRYIPTPENPDAFFQKKIYNMNRPENFRLAEELREKINQFSPERFLIGEVSGNMNTIREFLGKKHNGLNLIFLFETINSRFSAGFFKKTISLFEEHLPEPFSPVYVFSNHDVKRHFSKISHSIDKAKILALLQFTVRGIPVTYYGEEIGMHDDEIPFRKAQDPLTAKYRFIPKFLTDLLGIYINRDGCRTPMQWNDEINAGFSHADQVWLNANKNYKEINVEKQTVSRYSLLNFYKKIINFRNKSDILKEGGLELLSSDKNILMFKRYINNKSLLIMMNFSSKSIFLSTEIYGDILLSTAEIPKFQSGKINKLNSFEGLIIKTSEK
ncbi:MAG: alpha-glucosidase [Spirochaetes bacterium]|nr:alpha-glucosidase [Spirochaetota bacterium]